MNITKDHLNMEIVYISVSKNQKSRQTAGFWDYTPSTLKWKGINLAPPAGLEPATYGLTVRCSTN